MVALRKTKDIRIKSALGIIYVFRVPFDTSLDIEEIIKVGRVLSIKDGMMSSVDVNANLLGRSGNCWNRNQMLEFTREDVKYSYWQQLITDAIFRTRSFLDVESKHPGLLPRLIVTKFQGKEIKTDLNVPRYYIEAVAFCGNCKEKIPGTQTIVPNNRGKVGAVEEFVPDNAIKCPKNSKFVHHECAAVSIPVENQAEIDQQLGVIFNDNPKLKDLVDLPQLTLLGILGDLDKYSADFARGAAYMYHLMTHKEE